MNNIYSNPQFLAGLAMMDGMPAHEAFAQAALQIQALQKAQMDQEMMQRQQYTSQMLPQIASELASLSPEEGFGKLVEIGLDPKDALLVIEKLGNQNAKIAEFERKAEPQLSNAELSLNAKKLNELHGIANTAQEELNLLEQGNQAFQDYEKETGSWTGPGTLYSKYAPSFLDNLILSPEARAAKQEIGKVTEQLVQNRANASSNPTNESRAAIRKGLPSLELEPEARKSIENTVNTQKYTEVLRDKFIDEWSKTHNKDLSGADSAFNEFIKSANLIDKNGKLNKDLYKRIPQIVKEFEMGSGFGSGDNSNEMSYYDQLIAERERRRKSRG